MSNPDIAKFYSEGRLFNAKNPYQSDRKKVLCVCSAGLLRSPTIAHVLATDYDFNTRSCGVGLDFALIPVDEVLIHWADEIVTAESWHIDQLEKLFPPEVLKGKKITPLEVADNYEYRSPELVDQIKYRLSEIYGDPIAKQE